MEVGVLQVHFAAPPIFLEVRGNYHPVMDLEVLWGEPLIELSGIYYQTPFGFLGNLQV